MGKGPASERFAAFISYSHAVDRKLAPALQAALQRFAKPWNRLRALRVFRDQTSLAATPGLWSSIERALAASGHFILLASPDAARSEWVGREVAYWRERKQASRILVVLTAGELDWDGGAGDFDAERSTALPPALRGAFAEEPRWVDLRWASTSEHLSLGDPRFRAAVADLAAVLHGTPKEDLVGEDVRQHRKTVRLARAAIASLATLALLAGGSAIAAVVQRNHARDQRDAAVSRQLALQAGDVAGADPTLSALLSVAAFRIDDTFEARGGMLRGDDRWRSVASFLTADRAVARTVYGDARANVVHSLGFTSDGRALLVGWSSRTVIWDPARHVRRAVLRGRGLVTGAAISPDGRTVATSERPRLTGASLVLWDAAAGRRVARLTGPGRSAPHNGDVTSLVFTPDSRRLVTADLGTVNVWDVARRRRLLSIKRGSPFTSLAISRDGRMLAIGTSGNGTALWDLEHRRHIATLTGPPKPVFTVHSLAFSPDGRTLAAGDDVPRIVLWDVAKQRRRKILRGHAQHVLGLAYSDDGKVLLSGGRDHKVLLYDAETGRRGASLSGHLRAVNAVAFAPHQAWLATGGDDGTAIVRRRPAMLDGHAESVEALAYQPRRAVLASGSLDGRVILWDAGRRRRLATLRGHDGRVDNLAFNRTGRLLAAGTDRATSVWDVARRRPVARLEGSSLSSAFSPDGRVLATAGGTAALRDTRTWKRVAELAAPDGGSIYHVAFSPDGRLLATGDIAGHVILWDVARRRVVATLRGHAQWVTSLAFSPDGRKLASGDILGRAILWDVAGRRKLATLGGNEDSISGMAFSPDGSRLAFSDFAAKRIRLWDVDRRRQLGSMTVGSAAASLAFSPDGRELALGGNDGTIGLRAASQAGWERHLCEVAGREMTRAEWRSLVPGLPYRHVCNG
jgi:WD40 repeat protein